MNTMSKAIPATTSMQRGNPLMITASGVWAVLLVLALFMSAFGIVYVKDINRRLFIEEQTIKKHNLVANERWSKLLLEQGTLTAQSRIAYVAQKKLGMTLPASQTVRLVTNDKPHIVTG